MVILVVVLIFRKPLFALLTGFASIGKIKERNMKFKLGSFELETLATKTQERLKEIASEPDLQKRLQMAKEPFLVDEAIKVLDEKDLETLNKLHKSVLKNSFLINWYNPINGVDNDILRKLDRLGLIKGAAMYDGDEVAWLTSTGMALLNRLNNISQNTNENDE